MYRFKEILFSLLASGALFCFTAASFGQQTPFRQVRQKFENSNQLGVQEKLFLHTDKNFYLAGEIVWFKIYDVDGAMHQPLHINKVAYVEILDRNQKPVAQAKISLSENNGSGSFYLPLTISSDHYILRAYTSWMKNFGPVVFFEKQVSIVNTIKVVTADKKGEPLKATAEFFPEGGQLVEGLESKIGFRITGNTGKGIDARGIITDNNGDTVLDFTPQRFGIGSFIFKPLEGRSYQATILLPEGQHITKPLPAVNNYGYVMNVTDNKDGRFKIRVQAKGKQGNNNGENVLLLGHTRQSLKVVEQGYVNYASELLFYIDKTKLADGVSHLTLFNENQQPVCERLVFIRPAQDINLEIESDKERYGPRQKVRLSFLQGTPPTDMDMLDCSVSVFHADDSLYAQDNVNIVSYLWLTSDLYGQIEAPNYYLSKEAAVEEAADNLLLTHGWRRFRWDSLLTKTSPIVKFIPEYRGHLITARVVRASDGKPAAGIDCFLSVSSVPFGLYLAQSDNNGIVKFDVKNYYGPGEIIPQVSSLDKNQYRVDILSPFSDNPALSIPLPLLISQPNKERLLERSIAMQTQNVYRADSNKKFSMPALDDTLPFFGKPDYTYLLADYKRFTTMEEVLREYVTSINVALRNGKLYMSIFDEITRQIFHDNMLVLLDGVPINDYNSLFSYDPLKVKKLEIIPRRYLLGARVFSGIASFETNQGKFDGFELSPGLVALDYDGLQLQREFYSPDHGTTSSIRIPDLRTTLYWKPELRIDKTGKGSMEFYTSDQKGKFIVVLNGISSSGKAVSVTSSFIVE